MKRICSTCCGNGEIVTDWETYLHGDDDENAVAECPDCDGYGVIEDQGEVNV